MKGVLADYRAAKKAEKLRRDHEAEKRNSVIDRIVNGSSTNTSCNTFCADELDSSIDSLMGEDDQQFFEAYRKMRLKTMSMQTSQKVFGSVRLVKSSHKCPP